MPTISEYVNQIRTAIYGEQVRGSIADSIDLLSNNFDNKDMIITGLANEIRDARSPYPNLNARLVAIGGSISGLGTRLGTAETNIGTLNSELGNVKTSISDLGSRLDDAETSISGLTANFNALGLYVAEGYVCQNLSSD